MVTADAGARSATRSCQRRVSAVVDVTPDGEFTANVMAETLNQSNLGELRHGSRVNLERRRGAGQPARRAHRAGTCGRHR